MTITEELLTGTFTITAEGKTYNGTTEALPLDFYDGTYGKHYYTEVLNDICEEQDLPFTAAQITDWSIT